MAQPVKLSDDLVLDARLSGEVAERSIAGQVEFWARLGRAADALLRGDQVLALKRRGDIEPLSACLQSIGQPKGMARLAEHLSTLPFPHYEVDASEPGLLVKIDADGTRTAGRFVNRVFTPVSKR